MTPEQRQLVTQEAMTWVGTPYAHKHALKGYGADCAMFPLAVFVACGVLPGGPLPQYSEQWFLHHSEEVYLNEVAARGGVETDALEPGNFAIWRIGRCYSHGAIILKWPRIIHSLRPRGIMTADATNEAAICRRLMKVFTL